MRPIFSEDPSLGCLIEMDAIDRNIAICVARDRRVESFKSGRRDQAGMNGKGTHGWMCEITGACTECVAAFFLGIPWSRSVNTFKKMPDVGGFEVRGSRIANSPLKIYPKDKLWRKFMLVTGSMFHFRVVGWIEGQDGAIQEHWGIRDPRRPPLWCVPQSKLIPFTWNDFRTGGTRANGNRPPFAESGGTCASEPISLSVSAARHAAN